MTVYGAAARFAFVFGASWTSWGEFQHVCRCTFASLAELTLLIVIVVTVVPAVLLMVLGLVPEAPTELCREHNSRISLWK